MEHKPFDIEAARNGAPVKTRGGSPARIICFDAKGPRPLVVLLLQNDSEGNLVELEEAWHYSAKGRFSEHGVFSSGNLDLVMA